MGVVPGCAPDPVVKLSIILGGRDAEMCLPATELVWVDSAHGGGGVGGMLYEHRQGAHGLHGTPSNNPRVGARWPPFPRDHPGCCGMRPAGVANPRSSREHGRRRASIHPAGLAPWRGHGLPAQRYDADGRLRLGWTAMLDARNTSARAAGARNAIDNLKNESATVSIILPSILLTTTTS